MAPFIVRIKFSFLMGIEEKIEEWCQLISGDLAERKWHDKAEISAYAKVKLLVAIHECIELQTGYLQSERLELVKRYSDQTNPNRFQIGKELTAINKQIAERARAEDALKRIKNKQAPPPSAQEYRKKEIGATLSNSGAWMNCRIKQINPIEGKHRSFVVHASFNRTLIDVNESKPLLFTLKGDKVGIIDNFLINDIVLVRFTIHGVRINETTIAHNLICSDIQPESRSLHEEPNPERSVATGAQ